MEYVLFILEMMHRRWNMLKKIILVFIVVFFFVASLIIILFNESLWFVPTKKVYFDTSIRTIEYESFTEWMNQFANTDLLNDALHDFNVDGKEQRIILSDYDNYTIIKIYVVLKNTNSSPLNEITVDDIKFTFPIDIKIRRKNTTWYREIVCAPYDTSEYVIEAIVRNETIKDLKTDSIINDLIVEVYGKKTDIYN